MAMIKAGESKDIQGWNENISCDENVKMPCSILSSTLTKNKINSKKKI
jgi:hypothetical protein